MSRKSRKNEAFDLPSFQMIRAASNGDIEAINAVLKHYEGYIAALSTRKMYDENRQVHYCVDETLRRRLETKLITKILGYLLIPKKKRFTLNISFDCTILKREMSRASQG